MELVKEERICSFCEESVNESFVVRKAVLCVRCHYFGNVQMGNVPAASIYCFSCKTYSKFKAKFSTGTVDFTYCANDSEGTPIYVPVKVTGNWDKHSVPNSLECGSCEKNIPVVLMYLNTWTTPVDQ